MKVICHNNDCQREGNAPSPFHLRKDGWKSKPGIEGGVWYCPRCNPPVADFFGKNLLGKSLKKGIEG